MAEIKCMFDWVSVSSLWCVQSLGTFSCESWSYHKLASYFNESLTSQPTSAWGAREGSGQL